MKRLLPLLGWLSLLLAFPAVTYGQNFIGLTKDQIPVLLKSVNPQFKLDRNAVNHTYNYLKYVDKISEQTILFFMSERNTCTYVRWMSDYANLNDITSMLNRNYRKNGSGKWSYTDKGETYTVTLVEEEWYFTVTIRKD